MAVINGQQVYECQKCGQVFENRSELASHSYHKHVKQKPKAPPKHLIPRDLVPEFKYLGRKAYAKVIVEGMVDEKGMHVDRFKYV